MGYTVIPSQAVVVIKEESGVIRVFVYVMHGRTLRGCDCVNAIRVMGKNLHGCASWAATGHVQVFILCDAKVSLSVQVSGAELLDRSVMQALMGEIIKKALRGNGMFVSNLIEIELLEEWARIKDGVMGNEVLIKSYIG
ncbi:hypothetical protein IFM89_036707 [Coptis chinensis]|uniref:Uncharacterized protein n=1 Tax=Coptis chinensis TaxID=261450 RepID=A0A835IKU9_9MAGN|nr:hypothetical protein IFM89_036707 [Coptis chinensis]